MSKFVTSPMPGSLVDVAVKEGDVVEPGQEICVVEAMKMQNVLRAPKGGKVRALARTRARTRAHPLRACAQIKAIRTSAGATLAVDEVIVEFE